MFCRAVKSFGLKFKPIPLFINSSEIVLHNKPSYQACLLHGLHGRVNNLFTACQLCYRCQKLLIPQNIKNISNICHQRFFCSWVNENKYKEVTDDEMKYSRRNKDDDDYDGQSAHPKSINGSFLLGDFKNKLDCGEITNMSLDDWSNLEKAFLNENPKLKSSWEAACMFFINTVKSTELGLSLADYIKNQGRTLNIATKTAQIRLLGNHGGPERHEQVLDLYNQLMEQTSGILDCYSLKNVMQGLCGTNYWKECFKLVEMLEPQHPSLDKYYTPMLLAALREGDHDNTMFLLEKLGNAKGKPEGTVYREFLKSCINNKQLKIEDLLKLMGKYRWFPMRETLFEIVQHFKRDGNPDKWTEGWVKINKNGFCPSCHQSLSKIELSHREFRKLQSVFLEKTLIGDDIYQRSNPLELENFKKFVEEQSPFDVVIDSLNVACKMTRLNKSFQLRRVVECLAVEKRMKVLMIGRKHMMGWSVTDMNSIRKHADCFFLENNTKDDPYLLYATLFSGPKTMFVSSDEMRDHKFMLGETIGEFFTKWQRSRQIQFLRITKFGKILLEWPRKENVKAQFNSGWHIPYDNEEERPSWQDPFTWLCLRQSTFDKKYASSSTKGRSFE